MSLKLIDKTITFEEIKLLARWRKKVQPLWGETFKVTYKGTERWVHKLVNNPNKMLFFVIKNNKLIGHVGYDFIGSDFCQIGNVIRGEGRSDGSMTKAVKMLIEMAYKMKKKRIELSVLANNERAIKFYTRIGFMPYRKVDKSLIMTYEKD